MSTHHTRTGKWETRWEEGRKQRSKTFATRREAERFDREQKTRRESGERVVLAKDTPYLDDFVVEWLERRTARGVKRNTRLFNASTYDTHIGPHLGHLRLADLTAQRLDVWQRELQASPYMANRAAELLGQLLADALRLKYVLHNPARDLQRRKHEPRKGKAISPEQVEDIRDYFLARKRLGYATLVSVMAYVGLRPPEAKKLRWEHLKDGRLFLGAEITKTRRPRYPAVPGPVLADLAQWRLACGSPNGLVFPRTDGDEWTKTDWDNWRGRWFKSAAPEGLRPYDLRHTCASLMIRSGMPPADVAAHMGHGLAVLFSTYSHEIEGMRGKSPVSIEQAILAARAGGAEVRRLA